MADSEFKVGHFVFAILTAFHQPDRGRLFYCYTGHISPYKTVKIHTVAISSRFGLKITRLTGLLIQCVRCIISVKRNSQSTSSGPRQ